MAGKYAAGTEVPVERSQSEIGTVLDRYGANAYSFGRDDGAAFVRFRVDHTTVRLVVALPDWTDSRFHTTETGRTRTNSSARAVYAQETRQRWRALLLAIKAKLEAVELGIATFDEEFLAYIELPDGSTVGPRVLAELETTPGSRTPVRMLPTAALEPPR
jgi:hypothetical protein